MDDEGKLAAAVDDEERCERRARRRRRVEEWQTAMIKRAVDDGSKMRGAFIVSHDLLSRLSSVIDGRRINHGNFHVTSLSRPLPSQ